MKHTEETKRRIGEASRKRGSAAIALAAKLAKHNYICSVDGCEKKRSGRGLCNMHYLRWRKTGEIGPAESMIAGEHISAYGYLMRGKKPVHVQVAEQALGKPLPKGAVVHHANGDKTDNRSCNLVICPSRAYHNLLHARMRRASRA